MIRLNENSAMRQARWLVLATLTMISGCAVNPTYRNATYFENPKVSAAPGRTRPKLVLSPVPHEQAVFIDSVTIATFSKHTGLDVVMPDSVRRVIRTSPDLGFILDTIAHYEYSKDELKANPGFFSIVNDDAVAFIRKLFDNADLLYLPTAFAISQDIFATYGYATYRLYDLNTGQLIFERSNHPNIALHGELGRQFMALSLASGSGYDLQECYSDKMGIAGPERYSKEDKSAK